MAETAEGFGDETTGLMSDNDNGRYDNRNEADSDENREVGCIECPTVDVRFES